MGVTTGAPCHVRDLIAAFQAERGEVREFGEVRRACVRDAVAAAQVEDGEVPQGPGQARRSIIFIIGSLFLSVPLEPKI